MTKSQDTIMKENLKKIREFDTGANRDTDEGKLDFEACLSPLVLERYAQYLYECQEMPNGSRRADDNWQKGMPLSAYMKSAWRHFFAWWKMHRGWQPVSQDAKELEDTICALMFNVMGYLHELLKAKLVDGSGGRPVVIPPRGPSSPMKGLPSYKLPPELEASEQGAGRGDEGGG